MKTTIRNFKSADAEGITDIQEQAVMEGLGSFALTPMNKTEMLNKFLTLQDNKYPCLVAEFENTIVGYANASPHRPRPGYRWTVEDSIYVTPKAQGLGVGKALLSELIKQSEKLGFRQMVAVIGDSENKGSIKLHKKCGFELSGKLKSVGYKNDQWLDVILMQRSLGLSDIINPEENKYPGTLYRD